MTIKLEEIKSLIKEAMPDAQIDIQDLAGDNNHYAATIKSHIFAGKNKIEQHKLVYKAEHLLKVHLRRQTNNQR